MGRSIRWTLIGWFGLLLAAVLGSFGALLYQQVAEATLSGVDAGLEHRADAIAGALEWDRKDGWELELSGEYLRGLTARGYYGIWSPDGSLFRSGGVGGPAQPLRVEGLRTRGDLRELQRLGPEGTRIVVERSIAAEHARLDGLPALVVGLGALVLFFGLFGGMWLARRSLAPVSALADAAAAVNERDFKTRLDEHAGPTELRPLCRAFNAALDRLESAFQKQARFTADASHELRTPVSIIRAQAEQALKHERTPEEYRAALEACLRSAERMTGLVEGLLTLARIDAGEEPPARGPVQLDLLVRETTELMIPAAEAAQVALACATRPVRVAGDARLLGEVLTNLVHNGIRYNRPGGSLDVDLALEDGSALLAVRDTGIGIEERDLPHLFERFFRVDPARTRAHGGSGLGLSIVHWIVEAHGGTIEVDSQPGVGSTFMVRLPACAQQG